MSMDVRCLLLSWPVGLLSGNGCLKFVSLSMCAGSQEAAFAVWKAFGSIATATAFFMDPYLGMLARLLTLIFLVAITLLALPYAILLPPKAGCVSNDVIEETTT